MGLDLKKLKELTASFKNASVRRNVDEDQVSQLVECLVSAVNGQVEEELLLECLRALRNLVAGVEDNQWSVAEKVFKEKRDGFDFWGFCAEGASDSSPLVDTRLRLCTQFLGNLVGKNLRIQREYFEPLLATLYLLIGSVDHQQVSLLACMPLLSLLQSASSFTPNQQTSLADSCPLLLHLLQTAPEEGSDFLHLCIPALIKSPHLFPLLSSSERASCLDLILPGDEEGHLLAVDIPPENLLVLSHDFTLATDGLLTTNMITSLDQLHPTQVLKMAQVLAVASGAEEHRQFLQGHRSLVLNTLYLLKMVHGASRSGVEGLSLLGKMSDTEGAATAGGKVEDGPAFGFLAALVRLLANLVWGNQSNQDLVGELEGLQLLLDCTQVDARNPLVTQWSILAVKALTENHPTNQAILAGLRRDGAMDGSLLKELNIQQRSKVS